MNKFFKNLLKTLIVVISFSFLLFVLPEPVIAQSCTHGETVTSYYYESFENCHLNPSRTDCVRIPTVVPTLCNPDCTVQYITGNCYYQTNWEYRCWEGSWITYWCTWCCGGWWYSYCMKWCSGLGCNYYVPGGCRWVKTDTQCVIGTWYPWGQCTPSCEPEPVTCDSCSAACGGGTQNCTDGCDTWSQDCNGQACIPECSLDLQPSSATLARGDDASFIAAVSNIKYGTVERVAFSSSDSSVANVAPGSDTTVVYQTEANGKKIGTVTVTAEAIMDGVVRCSDTSTLELVSPGPWWQVKDSDVITNGNLVSDVPLGEYFGLDGAGGYPGVAVYGGSTDLTAGRISSKEWLANSLSPSLSTRIYDYDWFERQVPADTKITAITDTIIDGSFFESGQLLSLRP